MRVGEPRINISVHFDLYVSTLWCSNELQLVPTTASTPILRQTHPFGTYLKLYVGLRYPDASVRATDQHQCVIGPVCDYSV